MVPAPTPRERGRPLLLPRLLMQPRGLLPGVLPDGRHDADASGSVAPARARTRSLAVAAAQITARNAAVPMVTSASDAASTAKTRGASRLSGLGRGAGASIGAGAVGA